MISIKIIVKEVILTNMDIANIEHDPAFGPYRKLALSNTVQEYDFFSEFIVCGEQIDMPNLGTVFELRLVENEINMKSSGEGGRLYIMKESDPTKGIEVIPGEEINVDVQDTIALLQEGYLPEYLYDGADALFYFQFKL